jgi:hypothetical protein
MLKRLWLGSIFGFLLGLCLAILLNPPPSGLLRGNPAGSEMARLMLASWFLLAFSGFLIGGMLGFVLRRRQVVEKNNIF